MDSRKNLFPKKVVKHWNRLLREVVESSSQKAFKTSVGVALGNMVL